MDNRLLRVALRQSAIYIPQELEPKPLPAGKHALAFVAEMAKRGYTLSEDALCAVNAMSEDQLKEITDVVNDVFGIGLNWAAMVKDWQRPKDVSSDDYFITLVANMFPNLCITGTTLPCGHLIPDGTFPLERYNGCPFCGTPFVWSSVLRMGQRRPTRVLGTMRDEDLKQLMFRLLQSKVPLQATMLDSLKLLAEVYPVPTGIDIPMKESVIALASVLIPLDRSAEITNAFTGAADILRLIWYGRTGHLRIFTPKVFLAAEVRNSRYNKAPEEAVAEAKKKIRLHFSRTECRAYAMLMENLPQSPAEMCEAMNPRREMWVRVIRALRLNEYARRLRLAKLEQALDLFYNKTYPVWGGQLEEAREAGNEVLMYELLRRRPGEFSRRLFSTMLRFGKDRTLEEYSGVVSHVQPRLLLTLASYAETYFSPYPNRHWVSPRPDVTVEIDGNQFLKGYSPEELSEFTGSVRSLYLSAMELYFRRLPHEEGKTVYIAPELFRIPVPIGDRSDTVQDASYALPGQQFPVAGDVVRLFMQWGKGLPAQHLDMDLSARLIFDGDREPATCAYYCLDICGCHHSGDIINIPDRVGTAEYIELNISEMKANGVKFVAFCCNAYSTGAVKPGVVVGWMNAESPMSVNNDTGVAYDPSAVEHQVRVPDSALAKGLVFGVLDIDSRTVTWLEMPLTDRLAASMNLSALESLLKRLREKVTIGEVLALKAKAWNLVRTDNRNEAEIAWTTPADTLDFI